LIGETPSRYIEKRRLSRAASALIETNMRIVDIAFDYGFNSHESFTRSFKKKYTITPSQFRKIKPEFRCYDKCEIGSIELNLQKGRVKLKADILHKSNFSIAGLSYSGSDTNEIFNLWQAFWLMIQKSRIALENRGCVGACLHDIDMRNNEIFVYYAGIEMDQTFHIPKEMKSVNIPESTYAVFKHKGPISEIEQTYDRIYGSWIPLTGNTPTMDLDIIVVDHRFKSQSNNSVIDILIPIQG
jgi:predicted transcriptional regulator YdeE